MLRPLSSPSRPLGGRAPQFENHFHSRSQWPRGLRHEMSSPAWTLGSWVRIPLEAWLFAFILFVLSCVSSGLATGWSLVQGVLPIVYTRKCKITEPHKEEAKARYGLERHWKGGYSLVSNCDGSISIPGYFMWDLRWTNWHLGGFFPST
jgi:hypothetical protein